MITNTRSGCSSSQMNFTQFTELNVIVVFHFYLEAKPKEKPKSKVVLKSKWIRNFWVIDSSLCTLLLKALWRHFDNFFTAVHPFRPIEFSKTLTPRSPKMIFNFFIIFNLNFGCLISGINCRLLLNRMTNQIALIEHNSSSITARSRILFDEKLVIQNARLNPIFIEDEKESF